MTANHYGDQVMITTPYFLPRKRSHSDTKKLRCRSFCIDDEVYRSKVLRLPPSVTEEEIEDILAREARELGIRPPQIFTNIETITSSLSATTIASDPTNKSSIMSQSTAPTSCASSEHRPETSLSMHSDVPRSRSSVPSILSDIETKRHSGFRNGIRKMAGFRKRKSLAAESPTMTSINSDTTMKMADSSSMESGQKTPSSVKSGKSYFSNAISTTKTSYETEHPIDQLALQRTMECKEILVLHSQQLQEKSRFIEYQTSVISELRRQRDEVSLQRRTSHKLTIVNQSQKNDKAIEDLEIRQLEEELKMLKEHDLAKRAVMIRLRHMEAYCQNPTPPPTPVDGKFDRSGLDPLYSLPERKVTDRDYHSLAQQYRERDVMDNLHDAKVNVLRGRQKKAVENLALKKERELEILEQQQEKEIDEVEHDYSLQEADLRREFQSKQARLEQRWRLQSLVVQTKMERITGLKHEPLPNPVRIETVV